jgi:hypothetical protein
MNSAREYLDGEGAAARVRRHGPYDEAMKVVDRLFDRRPLVRRAVLSSTDQKRNVLPSVCVKSGVSTDGAIVVRAVDSEHAEAFTIGIGQAATVALFRLLRRPTAPVAVTVSVASWRLWKSRLTVAVVVSTVGFGLALVGVLRGITGLVVVGLIVLALGWVNRVRAWHNAWIGIRYRATKGEFVVSRVHSAFDAEAKALYSAAVINRSRRP